jgi:hypothetical protein
MQTNPEPDSTELSPIKAQNKPFLIVETVTIPRIVYNAGYNYKNSQKIEANFYFSRKYTEADVFLFYELRGADIPFNRIQIKNLIFYKIPKIEINYFNLLCYELNK